MTKAKPQVVRVSGKLPASDRQRARNARRALAQGHVRKGLTALLEGAQGQFRDDVVEALLSQSVDIAAAHRDGAFACASVGFHANRVGGQLPPSKLSRAAADALFSAEGGE